MAGVLPSYQGAGRWDRELGRQWGSPDFCAVFIHSYNNTSPSSGCGYAHMPCIDIYVHTWVHSSSSWLAGTFPPDTDAQPFLLPAD